MRLDTGSQVEWCKERSGIISFLFTEEETGGVVFTTLKNKDGNQEGQQKFQSYISR